MSEVPSDLNQRIAELEQQLADLERARVLQEEQYQSMLENSPAMLFRLVLSVDGDIDVEFASRACETIYGFTPDELIEQSIILLEAVVPADQQSFQESLRQAATNLGQIDWEGQIINRYGQERWIHIVARSEQRSATIVVLNGIITDVSERRAAEEQHMRLLSALEATSDLVCITNNQGQFEYLNQAGRTTLGIADDVDISTIHFSHIYPAAEVEEFQNEIIPIVLREGIWSGERNLALKNGRQIPISQVLMVHLNQDGTPRFFSTLLRDLTPQKKAEAERNEFQERIIQMQHAMIAELSTPLIPLTQGVLVLPLIGTLDSQRTMMLIETVLEGVSQQQAHTVIIDITGVSVIDTQVASIFLQLAQSIQLLGAQTVLTGIRPEVAQTIVGLGINFDSLVTRSDLQAGIGYALKTRRS